MGTKIRLHHLFPMVMLALAWQTPRAFADTAPRGGTVPWVGAPGITEPVSAIMARARITPPGIERPRLARLSADRRGLRSAPGAKHVSAWPSESVQILGAPPKARRDAPQTTGLSFDGPTMADTPSYTPPDAMGAAGPTQFLVTVNGRFRTYDKAAGVADGALNVDPNDFFASVMTTGVYANGTTDPRVRFDRLTNRWFITMIDLPSDKSYNLLGNNRVMIAVSSGPTITSTSSFTFHYFQQNTVSPAGDTGLFADYPTLGLDKNALYIGANMYTVSNSYNSTTGWVVRKSSLLGTGAIVATAFRNLATVTGGNLTAGMYSPQGVDNDNPNATEGYFIGVDNLNFGLLVIRRVSNPAGTPTLSADLKINVLDTALPPSVKPLGSSCPLDTSDDRLLAAQVKLNPTTGTRTLWTTHQIGVDSLGTVTGTVDRVGARWYEIQGLTTTPTLRQSGTLYDGAAASPRSYTYPALATSGQGHVAMSCSTMGPAERTGIALTGRLNGATLGALQPVTMALTSLFNYNVDSCTTSQPYQRWGDYGYTSVDPNDDMTMWTVQEYCNATNIWAVRVIKLIAPPPATPASCLPNTLAGGATGSITLTGTSTNGSGFFDPGAGFTNRLSAGVSGTGVSVTSVAYVSPTQVVLTVNVAAGAPAGARTITVTNPDGQSLTSVTGIFTVLASPFIPADAATALKIAAGLITASPAQATRYNIVSGNAVSVADATLILRKAMGLGTNP